MQLESDFKRLKIIKLEQNYRSTNRNLHAANTLIEHNSHVIAEESRLAYVSITHAQQILVVTFVLTRKHLARHWNVKSVVF